MSVESHKHNGQDSPRIDYRDLSGIPTNAGIPDWKAEIGTLIFDTTNNRLYIRAESTWRYITTT